MADLTGLRDLDRAGGVDHGLLGDRDRGFARVALAVLELGAEPDDRQLERAVAADALVRARAAGQRVDARLAEHEQTGLRVEGLRSALAGVRHLERPASEREPVRGRVRGTAALV